MEDDDAFMLNIELNEDVNKQTHSKKRHSLTRPDMFS